MIWGSIIASYELEIKSNRSRLNQIAAILDHARHFTFPENMMMSGCADKNLRSNGIAALERTRALKCKHRGKYQVTHEWAKVKAVLGWRCAKNTCLEHSVNYPGVQKHRRENHPSRSHVLLRGPKPKRHFHHRDCSHFRILDRKNILKRKREGSNRNASEVSRVQSHQCMMHWMHVCVCLLRTTLRYGRRSVNS